MFKEKFSLTEKASTFDRMRSEEIMRSFNSDLANGLKADEVQNRLKQYGYNEVPEKKTNPLRRFTKKFWGLTAWMLEIIIVISWILQRYSDLYIVTGLLVFNAVLGFVEEQRASNAVEALKGKLRVNARVLRDGFWKTVASRELVPGDARAKKEVFDYMINVFVVDDVSTWVF